MSIENMENTDNPLTNDGQTIHVYLSNKNLSKLEKQGKQYVTKRDFDEFKKDILTWSDIKNFVNYADAMRNTKPLQEQPVDIEDEHFEQNVKCVSPTIETIQNNVQILQPPPDILVVENDLHTMPIAHKKLPTPPQKILDTLKEKAEGNVKENIIEVVEDAEIKIDKNETETKEYIDDFQDVKFGDIEKITMEFPDLYETKKLISESYNVNKSIKLEIPDTYETKELIQNVYEEMKLEKEKLEKEKLEQEKLEQEKLEQEKLEKEKLEQEKLEKENAEIEMVDMKSDDTVHIKEDNEIAVHIKNIFDVPVSNTTHTDTEQSEIEMVQFKKVDLTDETLTVDDLIIKTVGEYEVLKEYRRSMSHQNEKIMNLSKSVLTDDIKSEQPVQQILVPISTKPVNAKKKHHHRKSKSTK
jgi:hypothetical protein